MTPASLPRPALVAYGALGLPLAFAALPLYVHVPRLYAGEAGLSLAAVGAVLLAARIVDAVTHRAQTLGEDWLVVLTTDHGHLDEGGHGGDDPRERESWVVAWSPTGELPDWPDEIIPSQLCGMLLDARYTNR